MTDVKKSRVTWAELSTEQLDELHAKHGEINRLDLNDEHFAYVRNPTRAEFREWTASQRRSPDIALENLVKRVLVHPDAASFETHLDRYPGLGTTFGDLVLGLAGVGQAAKKSVA